MKKVNKKTSEEKTHSEFGGSVAERYYNCPGSIPLSRGMPNEESEAALKGTEGHACLEFILRNRNNKEGWQGILKMSRKKWGDKMTEHALESLKYLRTWMGPGCTMLIEHKVNLSPFTTKNQGSTLDVAIVMKRARALVIYDYKYGYMTVEPEENKQLISYALAMLLELGPKNFDRVHLIIGQPNVEHEKGPNREWLTTPEELLAWGKKLKKAVNIALGPNPPLKYGEKWCTFCPARIKCPELKKQKLGQAQLEFDKPIEKQLPSLTDKKLNIGDLLQKCERLKVFIKAVEERAYHDAKKGLPVKGYKLVEKQTTRKWKDEDDVIKVFKTSAYMKPKLCSPAQIEAKFKKNKKALAWVKKNTTKAAGGTTLVRDTDKRRALKSAVETEFTVIEE